MRLRTPSQYAVPCHGMITKNTIAMTTTVIFGRRSAVDREIFRVGALEGAGLAVDHVSLLPCTYTRSMIFSPNSP